MSVQDISKLREVTGAGMMDCKKALDEVNGNFDAAVDLLRTKGIAKAAKRADKVAAEGLIGSYIHGAGKIGVLVEVNCETDFVAKNESFQNLVADIGMHIAAAAPQYVSPDQIPADVLEREKAVYRDQLKNEGKPAEMIEKILEGKLNKFYADVCLLKQSYIKDEDKTVEQLLTEKTVEIGEKVSVRRFSRFVVGEGIEKKQVDYLAEVQEQLGA